MERVRSRRRQEIEEQVNLRHLQNRPVCPVCNKEPVSYFKNMFTKKIVYKHVKFVEPKMFGGKRIRETYYHEVPYEK